MTTWSPVTGRCVFCTREGIDATEESVYLDGTRVYRFTPLDPVTPGHMLFVADRHTQDAASDPTTFSRVAETAARWVARERIEANVITSVGPAATQTMLHLHVHVVPRTEGDGLTLPWTGQVKD